MNTKNYLAISGTVFALVSLLHLLRIVNQSSMVIAGWSLDMPVSWFGFAATGALAFWAFRLFRGRG